MLTNYYFISSPLHLLFSANLAIQNKGQRNIAILISKTSAQIDFFSGVLKNDQSVFSELLSFERGQQQGKTAERKRRLKLISDFVQKNPPQRIYTGTDRRVEFQFAMYSARKSNPNVKGIYLDEGMATYLGHRYMDRLQHKWVDPLLKKLAYGFWWNNPLIIGHSKWIDEVYAAFPDCVHPLLHSKKIQPMNQNHFNSDEFNAFALALVSSSSIECKSLSNIRLLILLTLESFYDNPEKHLSQIIQQATKHIPIEQIAIKAHPRSKAIEKYRELYPQAAFLDNQVGLELLLPHLNRDTIFIGDISSTLMTIKWFNSDAKLGAVELKQDSYSQTMEDIKSLYQKIGVPSLEYSELKRVFE